MASSSAPSMSSSGAPPAPHTLYGSVTSNHRGHVNPLQQRAAAAAQALLAPGRKVSQLEIQAMLEKNEAALKTWNALHKQQPSKTNPMEHKEWVRRCVAFRQQVGARLELLASLADKQIAQEDETGGQRNSPSSTGPRAATPQSAPQQMYAQPQVLTMASGNSSMGLGASPALPSSVSMAMPVQTPQNLFLEPPMSTENFQSTSSSMFFPTGQMNTMQASAGFTNSATSLSVTSATASTQGFAMSSGIQAFTPNAYMAPTSGPPSSSAAFMNQQNFMMSSGMMNPQQQQFMPLAMPMNLTSSGGGNMYGNNNFGMNSAPTSANNPSNGNSNSNNFPVDPFITPLGYGPDANFGAQGFPMAGMNGMPMNGGNFAAQGGAPMVMNNFGYGMSTGSTSSLQGMLMPVQQFQPTPGGLQPFQQQNQLPPQQTGVGSMSMSPDSALYGDSNVNIFEGLTDDAFFPMQ